MVDCMYRCYFGREDNTANKTEEEERLYSMKHEALIQE